MKGCCEGNAAKGIFLILIAAFLLLNDLYDWFSLTEVLILILALSGLKMLFMTNTGKK